MKSTGTRRVDLTGQRFGRLVAQAFAGKDKRNNATWLCTCDCGVTVTVTCVALKGSHKRSCGCLEKENQASAHGVTKHGMCGSREYSSYWSAKERCTNPNEKHYSYYGGRGIKFLFPSFQEFFAHIGARPEGTSLDRYPNRNGNYEPGNVRWATRAQQAQNTAITKLSENCVVEIKKLREANHTISSIAQRFSVSESVISRILSGESWKEV